MQCSRDVENRGKVSVHKKREAVARPQQRMRPKKIAYKLGLGLNFAVNVDFWVCNDDFNKKTEGKNVTFVVSVFMT